MNAARPSPAGTPARLYQAAPTGVPEACNVLVVVGDRAAMRIVAARRFSVASLVTATVLVAACGGGSEPASAPAAPPPAEPVPPPPAETPPAATTTAEPAAPTEAEPPPATEAEPPAEPEPAPLPGEGLPEDILGYQDWLKLNEQPVPPTEGGDPHLGTKDIFASQEADRSGGSLLYPDGTIIVKEATRPDADFIGLVAIMRKEAGADPEHGDWIFVEYTRSSPDEPFSVQARDAVCWSCHAGAEQTDWVWVHTTGAAP